MAELLAKRLLAWRLRKKLYRKEAAAILDIPVGTYRCYEEGKRTPIKLSLVELERRLSQAQ